MKNVIKLSFVLTTYNKIEYLREVLNTLITNCQADEEIVVADGGSVDGTKEYLQNCYNEGSIHQYVSEKDYGESHGFNKTLLMAKGELIKIITDDDVFHYPSIEVCKKFMLSNLSVDILNTSGGWGEVVNLDVREFTGVYVDFYERKWLKDGHPFAHCALGIMIRKSSLAKIGLFNVGFVRSDAEFTLRFTSNKVNFCWYTGVAYVRILNPESNSIKMQVKIAEETQRLSLYYQFDIDKVYENLTETGFVTKQVRKKGGGFKKIFSLFKNKMPVAMVPTSRNQDQISRLDFADVYRNAQNWLRETNTRKNKFIGNDG